jgi:hypothetical protein
MILISPYKPHEVVKILNEEMDKPPSILRYIIPFDPHYIAGTSAVCGTINESGFELRNRRSPAFSLKAKGKLTQSNEGTKIEINFLNPSFPYIFEFLMLGRNKYDREKIVSFLREYLKAEEKPESTTEGGQV